MSASESPAADEGGARVARLQQLAIVLGVELPPFKGPLVAFDLDDEAGTERPVFLGGDLHAVHPEADERHRHPHDPTLDSATITLVDLENEPLENQAIEGIWCIRLGEELLDPAPYLSIFDSEGRLRTWLILPPPRLMISLAHFWLPAVPPFPGEAGGEGPGRHTPHS
jgi:hypothetical protein